MAPSNKKSTIHVLHVDDDSSILEISKQILMDMDSNFEFDDACSVDEAFKKLSTGHYDVVVSDYEMPLKNGLDFLRELREQSNEISFILFTGKGREDIAVKALNLGADRYINKQGSPETVYCELADAINKTAESKKSRKLLAASESKYRVMVEKSLQGIIIVFESPLKLVFANETMGNILNYSSQELISLSPQGILDLVYYEDRAIFFSRLGDRLRGKPTEPFLDFRAVKKGGSIIWLRAVANRIDFDGQPAVQGMFLDINESKKLEDVIKEKLDMLEALTQNIGAGFVTISKDYRVLYANKFVKNNVGNVEGKPCYASLNNLDHICPDCGVKKIFEDGAAKDSHEYSQIGINGKPYFVDIIATPLKDKDGNVTAALEFIVDVGEKKRLLQKLLASEEKFRAISDCAIDAIFMFDKEDKITYWNPAAERIFGYLEKEMVGEKVNATIVPPRYRKDHLKFTEELARDSNKKNVGNIQEFPALRKDGEEFPMELSMAPLQLEGKQFFVAIARDITNRKKAKMELQDSEARYQSLFEQAPLPVAISDLDGTMLNANGAMQTLTGYSLEELKKSHITNLYEKPQDRKTLLEPLKREGVVSDFFTQLKRKDGTLLDVVLNVSKFEIGQVSFLRTTIQDVTERKKAEEALEEVLDQLVLVNEKLGVVGSLTRHDVRNKLSAVTGYAYLLKKKHSDQADIVDGLSKIEQAVKDSIKIFDFAKTYEQLGVEELAYIDVEKTINEAVALFSGFNLEVVNDCRGLTVLADSFLRQLFYNFMDNSLKHGENVTQILLHYTKEGEVVKLFYEDNGVGISEPNKPKLFTEGFSTRKSTGLGLFLIKKMMDVYGWQIEENGTQGKGARFTITIPKINPNGKEIFQIT